jgi:hypothetical protein
VRPTVSFNSGVYEEPPRKYNATAINLLSNTPNDAIINSTTKKRPKKKLFKSDMLVGSSMQISGAASPQKPKMNVYNLGVTPMSLKLFSQ